MFEVKIENLPNYAEMYQYVVVSKVDSDYWFYGAYNSYDEANEIAQYIDGMVFKNFR